MFHKKGLQQCRHGLHGTWNQLSRAARDVSPDRVRDVRTIQMKDGQKCCHNSGCGCSGGGGGSSWGRKRKALDMQCPEISGLAPGSRPLLVGAPRVYTCRIQRLKKTIQPSGEGAAVPDSSLNTSSVPSFCSYIRLASPRLGLEPRSKKSYYLPART